MCLRPHNTGISCEGRFSRGGGGAKRLRTLHNRSDPVCFIPLLCGAARMHELAWLAQRRTPSSRQDEPREGNPLLAQKSSNRVPCPRERLRWCGLAFGSLALRRQGSHNRDGPTRHEEPRPLDQTNYRHRIAGQEEWHRHDVEKQVSRRAVESGIAVPLPPEQPSTPVASTLASGHTSASLHRGRQEALRGCIGMERRGGCGRHGT